MSGQPDLKPRLRILLGASTTMGPGKADLLDAIIETGSIAAAARRMKMSYRRAWLLVEEMNQAFRDPLVEATVGGAGGGGTSVTAAGREALRRYRDMEVKAAAGIAHEMADFAELLTEKNARRAARSG